MISTRGMHKLEMQLLKATNHSNNSSVINNFVMKCIENIFYLLFYAESDQKNMCIFSCECPFKSDNSYIFSFFLILWDEYHVVVSVSGIVRLYI